MKCTLARILPGLLLCGSALLPALDAFGQGQPVPGPPASYGTGYPPPYVSGPASGYHSRTAFQTTSRRSAANAVLDSTIGYRVSDPFGPRINLNGIFGDRRGIETNDYSVSGFLPWHIDPGRNLMFVVVRGTTTSLGDFIGNFGVGQRMYFENLNRIIGASVWYDLDDTHNRTYRRAGVQLETIGRYMEVRGGADLVIDENRKLLDSGFTAAAPVFTGNNIAFTFFNQTELAYDHAYIEAGGPMPLLGRYGVNAYASSYFVWHDDADEALGWGLRTSADITRDVSVGARFTKDDIFGSNTSVSVALSFPTGGLKQIIRSPRTIVRGQTPDPSVSNQAIALRPGSVASELGRPVARDHRPLVHIERTESLVLAIDPTNGLPVCVLHVDPNAAAAGSGTFEDPFRTLEAARLDNDGTCRIIRVIPRNDNTGTNLVIDGTFELFTNQRLLASSRQHTFDSTRGTFVLPGFTGTGPGPLVTHSDNGHLISMGDNTEVSGFRLMGSATGNAIIGSPNGFDINRNVITNSLNGVALTDARGTGLVTDNTISENDNNGLSINNPNGGTLDLVVMDNNFRDNGNDGAVVGMTGGTLRGAIIGNSATGNGGNGFTINADSATIDFRNMTAGRVVMGNEFGSNTGDGFRFNGTNGADAGLRFLDNDFGALPTAGGGNMGSGLRIVADSGNLAVDVGGPLAADGNRFLSNMGTGAQFDLTGTAQMALLFQNNLIGLGGDFGDLIRAGFNANTLAANDDLSTGLVPIGFDANFFGTMFNQLFVNNNGNVTFNNPLGTFTPFPIVTNGIPIIAPFFADVDTRAGNEVTYGQGTVNGRQAFGVNYIDVRHFNVNGSNNGLPTNSFQLVLIDRSDISAGDFDIEFNYDRILWEAGTASGSDPMGLGGNSARVGFSNGTTNSFELAGSAVNGALLDSGPPATSLVQNSMNSGLLGRYVFEARNGGVNVAPTGPGVDGLQINTDGNAVVTEATIDANQINSVTGNGINVQAGTGSTVNNLNITNNQIRSTGNNAIRLAADNQAIINLTSMMNNRLNGSGLSGFRAESTNFGTINIANFTGNDLSGNAGDGATLIANGVNSVIAGGLGVSGGAMNTFNNNNGFGINLEASDGGIIRGQNGTGNFAIVNNVIGTTDLGNGMGGINAFADATAPVVSTLNLTIGGANVADGNLIDANTDVGLAFSLDNSSTGELVVMNNEITNTIDDVMMTTTPLMGQGMYIEVAGTATLNNSVFDANTITGNASHGIQGFIRENAIVTDLLVGNMDGDDDDGNLITDNGGDGINWLRRDNGQVINMDIFDNTLMGNANGLNLIAQNANLEDTYDVNDNIISMNTQHGIRLRVEADADLHLDLDNNQIAMNMMDGINASESTNAVTDSRSVRGTWTNNEITENMGDGIELGAATSNLMVGTTGNGNLISMNGMDGVVITGAGSATFTDNIVTNNGTGGFDIDPATANNLTLNNNDISDNMGIGVDIDHNSGTFSTTVALNNNSIERNTGDGLEIRAFGAGNGTLTINSFNNEISENQGRGVDILNQENADSIMSFNSDMITSNGLEGFYVVNTASGTQNQTDPAMSDPTGLASDGAVDATPTLNLTLSNSTISFNGNDSDFDGTGLVIRVGTSDGGRDDFTDPGGFASDGRGGVIASVTNNMFSGNFGDDVIFESFTSTVDPIETQGTWDNQDDADMTNDDFEVTAYESDPLARLDLVFTGNTGDSADVTRMGAFYDNPEPEFKSRDTDQDPPGPFNVGGTRRRNAQRLAARELNMFGDFRPPFYDIPGANDEDFLYPGVSAQSTFRVSAASNTAGFGTADGFASSVDFMNPIFGELPFEWGTLP